MNKKDVIKYFNECAPSWDANRKRNDRVVNDILDIAGIKEGVEVLDVACGTGELFSDYINRSVGKLIGIDISPKMVEIAKQKYPDVELICADVEAVKLLQKFDAIVVYNAFPHFPDPEELIHTLSHMLKPGGRLTIAHGMSKEALALHHSGSASKVSIPLLHEDELAAIMDRYLLVDTKIADDEKYVVSAYLEESHEHHHSHHHSEEEKKKQINRIAKAIGHLQHVKTMIEDDEDCSDVLVQLSAVRSALTGLGKEIINEHIAHCVTHAVEEGDEEAIDEFRKAIEKFF